MKFIKIFGHPVLVMSLFLLLLISGRSFGGFYAIYILMGLLVGSIDSIVSLVGLGIMLLGYKLFRSHYHPVKSLLYIIGNSVMIFALVTFFKITKGYNDGTFEQTIPLISFGIYGVSVLCNLLLSVNLFFSKGIRGNDNSLNMAS